MIGFVLQDKYELMEEIGSGGTALVYKAYCKEDGKYYAAKILRPELVTDIELLNRFERESYALSGLAHPNIVNIYAVGVEEYYNEFKVRRELHYIIMDYVDGMTLKKYITARGALNPREAGYIAMQVCSALTHAHNNGIIHRDIKSQNIILNRDMQVKVADFGLARTLTQATLSSQTNKNVMGSVHYMSPEQTRNGYVSESTDLYSLGVVLYEALTGKLPFSGDDPVSVALKHVHEKLPPMIEQYPNLPKAYCYIVDKALQKNTIDRYKTAAEMQNDLAQALVNGDADLSVKQNIAEKKVTPIREKPPAVLKDNREVQREYEENSYSDTGPLKRNDRANARKKRKKKVILIRLGIIAGIVLILGGILAAVVTSSISDEYTMPYLIGKNEEEALGILADNSVRRHIKERRYSDEYNAGIVIEQSPAKDKVVKKNSDVVELVISKGPEPLEMPELTDMTLEKAIETLAAIGIEEDSIQIKSEPSAKENNIVFKQEPLFGETVFRTGKSEEGEAITIYVTDNGTVPETVKVPGLIDLTKAQAIEKLDELGLAYEFENDYSNKDAELVYYQLPSADTMVEKGTVVKVYISKGPLNSVDMPELMGLSGDEAINRLTQLGLSYNIEYNPDSDQTVGLVYDYSPKKKKVVPGTDLITIWIAGEEPYPTPSETIEPTPSEAPEPTAGAENYG